MLGGSGNETFLLATDQVISRLISRADFSEASFVSKFVFVQKDSECCCSARCPFFFFIHFTPEAIFGVLFTCRHTN